MTVPLFVFCFVGVTIALGAFKGNRLYRMVAFVWLVVLGFGIAAIAVQSPTIYLLPTVVGAIVLAALLWAVVK